MSATELPGRSMPARVGWSRAPVALLVLLAAAALPACKEGSLQRALSGEAATSGTVLASLSLTQTAGGQQGAVESGMQPSGSTTGFELTVTPASDAVTNGGTAVVTLSAAMAFNEVNVGVTGLDGFFRISLPSATTSVELQLTIDQDVTDPIVVFQFSAGDGTDYGPIASEDFAIVFVGSGDVQVSVTFDQQDDVDLSVMDPSGETVFFGNRTAASGGMLDLDANPVCTDPRGNAENITWPEGTAPEGTYQVFLDLFDSCFPNPVNWVLTVTVTGSPPQIFSGTFQPADELLGPQLITTFEVMAP